MIVFLCILGIKVYMLFNKKILLSISLILLLPIKAFATTGLALDFGFISVPLGKKDTTDQRYYTPLYGLQAFTDLGHLFRLNYGVKASFLNGYLVSLPISLSYVPEGLYTANINPSFFAGLETFYSTFSDFQGLKYYGFAGVGVDYNINENYYVNSNVKMYINNSYASKNPLPNDFNSGNINLSLNVGYKI